MGSVKETKILQPAYENQRGIGEFEFSNDYSIFDWGKMPNRIRNKGKALATMSAFNFEQLEDRGIDTHYHGLVKNDELFRTNDFGLGSQGSSCMQFSLAVRYDPVARRFMGDDKIPRVEYDYSFFENNRGKLNRYLVPLEIIFRNGLPKGSSIFKKLKEAEGDGAKTKKLLDKLGLKESPKEGDMLPKPIMTYTTKLEEGDRSLSEDEAYQISGLTEKQFLRVAPLALRINDYITERCEQTGLAPHWDGKVEMAYFNGSLILVDAVGTLDEDRMGDRISKEFLRQWYKENQPGFAEACDEYKQTGPGWQERCPVKPISLPEELSTLVSQMYMAACNQYIGKNIFSNVPELGKVMERLKPYRD